MDDKIEIKDLTQGEPTATDWLIYQSDDDGETYKAPKSDIEGENAYVYVAYADDEDGNGFTNTFNESKDYVAIKATNTEIPAPVASDFAGLWKNYKGQKGDNGVAATATAGTTTTLAAGQNAKVTNVGTTSAAVFKFEIPKGDKGDDGAKIVTAEFVGNDIHFNLDDGTEAILVGAKTDLKGATGNTGASVVDAEVSGDDIVFTKSDGSTITIENILIELKGEAGNGIATIEKTDTTGLVDTYTITYDDETTKTFTVTNGAKGDTGDNATVDVRTTTTLAPGQPATVTNVGTTQDAVFDFAIPQGEKGDTGNGISSIEKTGTSGLNDTYTITFTDEKTTTFDVVNGEKGDNAYIYVAYASDDSGTNFTTTFNPLLNYVAILSTYTEIETPEASDFAGLWKNYKGEKGDTGDKGINWLNTEYSGATTYNVDDALFYNGSSYRCILESTGHLPTDATYWALIAQKGLDGGGGDMLASVYDQAEGAEQVAFASELHNAVTVTDSTEIGFTLTGQDITASIKNGSIDETKLDTSVNASLDLADTAIQTETDPVVGAITGIVKANGAGTISAASAGTDYQAPLVADTDYLTPGTAASTYQPIGSYLTDITGEDLGDLSNVTEATPADNDLLVYVTDHWENQTLSEAGIQPAGTYLTSANIEDSIVDGHTTIAPSGNAVFDALALKASLTGAETITNKRITKRVASTTDDATAVIDGDSYDEYYLTAIANDTEISITGTPTAGQTIFIGLKDAGSAKALTWTGITGLGQTLPTTTVAGKQHIIGIKYIASAWRAIAVSVEA